MERKTWCYLPKFRANLYPNMYTILVAPAGAGKGVLLDPVRALLSALPGHHLSPNSLSGASLIDALEGAERRIIRPQDTPSVITYNALTLFITEFGVLLPMWDRVMLNNLTDIWDGKPYRDKKRGKDLDINLAAPQLNLLTATVPSYLKDILPDTAWDHGFMSRTMLIYSGEVDDGDIFQDDYEGDDAAEHFDALLHDLEIINSLYGKFVFTPETVAAIREWRAAGSPPKPEHPKLVSYLSRRTTHLLKLCMAISVSESNDLVIDLHHYQRALGMLLEAESFIPDIFKAMRSTGGDQGAMQELYHFMYETYMRGGKKEPIAEGVLVEFLMEKVPAHSIMRIIESMARAGVIEEKNMPMTTKKYYVPRAKRVPS